MLVAAIKADALSSEDPTPSVIEDDSPITPCTPSPLTTTLRL